MECIGWGNCGRDGVSSCEGKRLGTGLLGGAAQEGLERRQGAEKGGVL